MKKIADFSWNLFKILIALLLIARIGSWIIESKTRPPRLTEDEFTSTVEGKSQDEVIQLIGNPDRINDMGYYISFIYHMRTYNPAAKNPNLGSMVYFENNRAIATSFY